MKTLAPLGDYLSTIASFEVVPIIIGEHAQQLALELYPYIPTTLFIPYLQSPNTYTWPINGCDIRIVDTGQSSKAFIKQCAICFYGYGAAEIFYISKNATFNIKRT